MQTQLDLFEGGVIKSIGFDEQKMIREILILHNNGEPVELDPTYSKGVFYSQGLPKPKYKFDLNPQVEGVVKADATNLPVKSNSIKSIMFDPPFIVGNHQSHRDYKMSQRFTLFDTYKDLEDMYKGSLREFYRILKPGGLLIFKCQDFTNHTLFATHVHVHNWAVEIGFNAEDLFILCVKSRIISSWGKQKHARKFHSYYWIFKKPKRRY